MTLMRRPIMSRRTTLRWIDVRTRLQQRWPRTSSLPYMRVLPRLWVYQWGNHR